MPSPTSVDRVSDAEHKGATVTIRVGPTLDAVTAAELMRILRAELDLAPARIDLDLGALDEFNDAGLRALAACQTLGADVPGGLHFRTDGGAGQDALLAAFTIDPGSSNGGLQ
ncbi:MAG: hypothetical protein ABIV94_09000 [Acidimicrobiales bacterium]